MTLEVAEMKRRRLMIVAPTFFPDSAISGIRVTLWTRYLSQLGWEILVVCRHHGFDATPESLLQHVGPNVEVQYLGGRAGSQQPQQSSKESLFKKIFKRIVRPLSIPDLQVWRWRRLKAQATFMAKQWKPDLIMSSSPPHSIHEVGHAIAHELQIPWIADFRDPYLIDSRYRPQGFAKILWHRHNKVEAQIYHSASLVLHAITAHFRWSRRRYPLHSKKMKLLTNGFPPELIESIRPAETTVKPRISIRAVGVMGKTATETMPAVIRQLVALGFDCEFRHTGKLAHPILSQHLVEDGRIEYRGPVPYRDALTEMSGADLLLKFDDFERSQVAGLSAKLFEYLALGKPVLVVNPSRPDLAFLRNKPWCITLKSTSPEAIAAQIIKLVSEKPRPSDQWLSDFHSKFSRRSQVEHLSGWLDQLITKTTSDHC